LRFGHNSALKFDGGLIDVDGANTWRARYLFVIVEDGMSNVAKNLAGSMLLAAVVGGWAISAVLMALTR
jgi:hypothetical protein